MNNLSCKNFSVTIEGAERISAVDLEVSSGQIIALVGPNGSGKSSFLKGIMSMEGTETTGSVLFDGEEITKLKIFEKAKKGIYFSPQHTPNLEGVKLISLLYGAYTKMTGDTNTSILDLRKKAIERAEKYNLNPDLLDRYVGVGLSGGEKKQSELLQLLTLKPKICLIDEIDSGVDVDVTGTIKQIVTDLTKAGSAVLLVSHNLHMLQSLPIDKVYVAQNGMITKKGGMELITKIAQDGF